MNILETMHLSEIMLTLDFLMPRPIGTVFALIADVVHRLLLIVGLFQDSAYPGRP